MTFEEAYQQIRKHHYEILDERESISKSARLSLSTWVLDILTECRDTADALTDQIYKVIVERALADTPQTETQTKTQNSNLTFEKDECAKEYEELGLKELKELIEADRKTEQTEREDK